MTDKLILALDVDSADTALALVRRLKGKLTLFKVGLQLFTREGPEFIRALRTEGVDVFLDLKFHDIPQTVAHAVRAAAALDVRYLTIHGGGGLAMMEAAQQATVGTRAEILAVTVLTSLDDAALAEIGYTRSTPEQVLHFAKLAARAGIPGLVCSPHEIALIRDGLEMPIKLVTPGVRSGGEAKGDQKRTLGASEAFQRGANHLVIGRPITQATDPVVATQAILAECGLA